MSTSDSLLVSEVISAYGSLRLDASLSIATTALLFYDAFLTSEKEYDYVWRTPRKWHQRVIYTLNKYTVLLGSALALGTIYPISDRVVVPPSIGSSPPLDSWVQCVAPVRPRSHSSIA
ncbi:hypothetical protein C8Q77DRAFT_907244 [Trametes polyzona]|nr:hypothetical protein C8Q77DRAFT_907244 [Trametes polyzona]